MHGTDIKVAKNIVLRYYYKFVTLLHNLLPYL